MCVCVLERGGWSKINVVRGWGSGFRCTRIAARSRARSRARARACFKTGPPPSRGLALICTAPIICTESLIAAHMLQLTGRRVLLGRAGHLQLLQPAEGLHEPRHRYDAVAAAAAAMMRLLLCKTSSTCNQRSTDQDSWMMKMRMTGGCRRGVATMRTLFALSLVARACACVRV